MRQKEALKQMSRNDQGAGVIEKRLDNTEVKQKIRMYLSGIRVDTVVDEETNDVKRQYVQNEEHAKLNDEGIQAVMSIVESFLNPSVVQGNTDDDEYKELIANFNDNVAEHLFINQDEYDLSDKDYGLICNKLRFMARLYISRTINDRERESYESTMQVNETQTVNQDNNNGFLSKLMGGT